MITPIKVYSEIMPNPIIIKFALNFLLIEEEDKNK